MRKICLLLFLANSYFAMAQSFVAVKGAYAFGRNGSLNMLSEQEGTQKIEDLSLATGIQSEISWIFCLSENFGITLDASFLLGQKLEQEGEIFLINNMPQPYFVPDNNGMLPASDKALISAFSLNAQRLYLSPSLLISTGGDGFNFYSKIGFSLPVYSKMELSYTHQDQVLAKEINTNLNFETAFSIGFKAALGANIDLSNSLGLFIEIDYLGMHAKAKTAEVTSYEIEGSDALSTLGNAKTINYSDNIAISNTSNTQNAREALSFPVVYNYLGLGLGLRLRFGQ